MDRDITVTGCLQRDANGGYILANAQVEPDATKSSTTGTTTGTAATTTTEATGTSGISATRKTWKLEGSTSDLDMHLGHKVQVTGREASASSSSPATSTTTGTTTGTTGTTATGEQRAKSSSDSDASRRLDVRSVKMISSSCP